MLCRIFYNIKDFLYNGVWDNKSCDLLSAFWQGIVCSVA